MRSSGSEDQPDHITARDRVEDLRVRGLEVRNQATEKLDDAVSRFWPVALVVEGVKRWLSTNASILAGHLAFRFFLFLVPTAVVLVSFLGFAASGGTADIESTSSSLRLSGPLARALSTTSADTEGTHVQLGLAGLFGIVIAGFSLVAALRTVFAAVWGVSPKAHKRSRLLTLLGIIMLVVILVAANALRRRLMAEGLIFTTMGVVAMLAVNGLFIGALTWLLPRRGDRWVDLAPSTIVGGIGLTALNTGAAWYFTDKLESQSETYGALGITLTLLTYLFVWGEVLVLSAIAGAVWYDRDAILGRDPALGSDAGGPAAAAGAESPSRQTGRREPPDVRLGRDAANPPSPPASPQPPDATGLPG